VRRRPEKQRDAGNRGHPHGEMEEAVLKSLKLRKRVHLASGSGANHVMPLEKLVQDDSICKAIEPDPQEKAGAIKRIDFHLSLPSQAEAQAEAVVLFPKLRISQRSPRALSDIGSITSTSSIRPADFAWSSRSTISRVTLMILSWHSDCPRFAAGELFDHLLRGIARCCPRPLFTS
jgi:hypothetical protein